MERTERQKTHARHERRTGRFRLVTLGRLALLDEDGRDEPSLATRPRKLAVLAWLALRAGRRATRDRLIGVFWGGRDEDRARNSLSDALSHLRRSLGRDALCALADEVLLADGAPLDVDALELTVAAAAGDDERVTTLYAGPFLDGVYVDDAPEFDHWRDRERARLAALFARSASTRCTALARARRWDDCRALAERWLDAEPASADAALFVLNAIKAPDTPEALAATVAAYEALVRRLDRELGAPPHASVTTLARDVAARLAAQGRVDTTARPSAAAPRHTVGRAQERQSLRQALAAAEGGRGALLSVAGEPGIGKTTLVEEFLAEVSSATRACRVARGRCSERLAGTEAYLPILEALDVLRQDGAAATLMKRLAPTWYLQLAPAAAGNSAEGRELARVQASSQERLKRELGAFLDELSRAAPVVLFLDDLHWADLSTVDVLAYLGTRLGGMRLLVVVTVRPAELALGRHPFAQLKLDLQARGVCRELALEFLTPGDVEQYLWLEFPGHDFPPSLAALIHAKTEGSPLFMADLLRDLRTRGVVSDAGGRWALAQSVPAIEHDLPESIRGMIQRKIEQLGEDDRRLLAAASVQGYEFDSAIVAAIIGADPADVEERLDVLDRVYRFVRRGREHELPDGTLDVRYRFVHVLYQNALYAALAPSRRVSFSARGAQALLDAYGERRAEIATELAALFEAARDTRRAVEHMLVAAQGAARVFANQEAVALSRRALRLVAQLPDTPERTDQELHLQSTLAAALGALQGLAYPEVGVAAARAFELWKQLGARPELFAVGGGMWGYYVVAAKLDVAIEIGEELLEMAERVGDRAMLVTAHNALSVTLHHMGEHRRALTHFERGLAAYGLDLSPLFVSFPVEPGVNLASEYARTLWVLGYPDQALRQLHAALALADAVPHPEARGFAPLFGAFVHHFLRDVPGTLRYAETVVALSRERDIVTTLAWGMVLHGWAVAMQGRVDEGITEIRDSLAGQLAAGSLIARPQFLAILADACLHAGRVDDALAATVEGLECSATTADHYWDSELERLRAEALVPAGGDAGEIDACLERALSDARARDARSLELRAATTAARVWQARDERARARDTLARVHDWFTEGLETPDLVAARELLARLG
ncbi:transcriptional activator domain-containing protein [Gemmatirosa kalamazoonensis]|uniref:Transcriptional activator domain-containing protein n=1 Tax=Gemmatirosa kalamazoonensis TaxID=861299 RepID=W0RF48_9BACT|nr:AAA family ATPase [Gemmatirosa kalamazoonensis]AHG89694.1 transcriptional activator domain-containing protein [Gemmatirosa kalamazoonensis]